MTKLEKMQDLKLKAIENGIEIMSGVTIKYNPVSEKEEFLFFAKIPNGKTEMFPVYSDNGFLLSYTPQNIDAIFYSKDSELKAVESAYQYFRINLKENEICEKDDFEDKKEANICKICKNCKHYNKDDFLCNKIPESDSWVIDSMYRFVPNAQFCPDADFGCNRFEER